MTAGHLNAQREAQRKHRGHGQKGSERVASVFHSLSIQIGRAMSPGLR